MEIDICVSNVFIEMYLRCGCFSFVNEVFEKMFR